MQGARETLRRNHQQAIECHCQRDDLVHHFEDLGLFFAHAGVEEHDEADKVRNDGQLHEELNDHLVPFAAHELPKEVLDLREAALWSDLGRFVLVQDDALAFP